MRRYSLPHPYLLSFFSRDFYRDVGQNWRGLSFVHLLLLLAIAWVPATLKIHGGLAALSGERAEKVVSQIPSIVVNRGEVSVEGPQPVYIKEPDSGKVLAIIDTTGQVTSLGKSGAFLLITKGQAIFRKNDSETRVYDLAKVEHLQVDKETISRWLAACRRWAAVVLYPILVLCSYIYRVLQVLVYACLGIAIAGAVRVPIGFGGLVSLAVMAVTPVIILGRVLELLHSQPPFAWLLAFGIAMLYLGFGIKASAGGDPPPVPGAGSAA